jgi:hypothetical protein
MEKVTKRRKKNQADRKKCLGRQVLSKKDLTKQGVVATNLF